jgi:hypothetical protein
LHRNEGQTERTFRHTVSRTVVHDRSPARSRSACDFLQ